MFQIGCGEIKAHALHGGKNEQKELFLRGKLHVGKEIRICAPHAKNLHEH